MRSLDRGDATISYRRVGAGPALLLLHATLSSSRDLVRLADRLGSAFTVYSIDRRGCGESRVAPGTPLGPIDVAVHVDDLAGVIDAEGLSSVTLAGHSYGGCLALEVAARHPDLVERTWLYEPPYAPAGPPSVQALLAETGRLTQRANDDDGPAAAAEAFLAAVSGRATVDGLSPSARARIRAEGRGAVADATLLGMDPDGIAGIESPLLVVTGSRSESIYAVIADAIVRAAPVGSRQQLPGADHMAPVTRPELVAASVMAFGRR